MCLRPEVCPLWLWVFLMWSVCVFDVVSVVGTVASLIHCCMTVCVHIELGRVSSGFCGCVCGKECVLCGCGCV